MYGDIREWANKLPVGDLFDLDDVQRVFPDKSRDAIKMTVSRLCRGEDPLITRVCKGIYTRRYVGAGYPVWLPNKAREAVPWRFAGPGSGVTGPYAINMFAWSTQVSPRLWVAMLGRPPEIPEIGVVFQRRYNKKRLGLNRWEVSILEAVRCFDKWAELSWEDAQARFADAYQRGYLGNELRGDLMLDTAGAERGLGPDFMPRLGSLVENL